MIRATDRAQTEPVGVVLLTAVVVLSVTTAGVVVFAGVGDDQTTRTSVSVIVTHDGVSVTHGGGESIPFSDLRVVVRNDSATWRPAVTRAGVVDGNGDAAFEPGERWVARRALGENVTTVYVVDTRAETVLDKAEQYPTSRTKLTRTPTATPEGGAAMAITTETPTATATATSTTATATDDTTATTAVTRTPTATPTTTQTATAPSGGDNGNGSGGGGNNGTDSDGNDGNGGPSVDRPPIPVL